MRLCLHVCACLCLHTDVSVFVHIKTGRHEHPTRIHSEPLRARGHAAEAIKSS